MFCENPNVIQSSAQREYARSANCTEGRFEPAHPAEGRGNAHRTPGIVPRLTIGNFDMATDTADPPLDPPGMREGSTGFLRRPEKGVEEVAPMANS